MPNATFFPLVREALQLNGLTEGYVVQDAGFAEYNLAKRRLPAAVADVYGVSKTAAYVKLRKTGFVVDRNTVNRGKKQPQFTVI